MSNRAKPNYVWDWSNCGMHIGYTPERIRVEGRGGAVEYVPDAGTCRNVAEFGSNVGGERNLAVEDGFDFTCSECLFSLDGDEMGNSPFRDPDGNHVPIKRCPECGARVVAE